MHCYGILITQTEEIFISGSPTDRQFRLSPDVVNTVRNGFIKSNTDGIILLSRVVDSTITTSLINILKANNITTGLFFIEDVLNIGLRSDAEHMLLDTSNMERYPNDFYCPEIEVILDIVNQSALSSYMIFSGEDNAWPIEKKYNIRIYYYDWFLLSSFSNPHLYNTSWNTKFDKKLVCFNRRYEPHRNIISALLHERDDIILTLNNRCSVEWITTQQAVPLKNFSETVRQKIIKGTDELQRKKLEWDIAQVSTLSDVHIAEEVSPEAMYNNIQAYNDTFVSLSTETRYASPMPYFSEKTFKSFYAYRPFILLAPPRTLQLVRDLGFRTFGDFWDESYDEELDHAKRLEKVYKVVTKILATPEVRLKQMLIEMEEILVHNKLQCFNFNDNMLRYCKIRAPI